MNLVEDDTLLNFFKLTEINSKLQNIYVIFRNKIFPELWIKNGT